MKSEKEILEGAKDKMRMFAKIQMLAFVKFANCLEKEEHDLTFEEWQLANQMADESIKNYENVDKVFDAIINNDADRILMQTGMNGIMDDLNIV